MHAAPKPEVKHREAKPAHHLTAETIANGPTGDLLEYITQRDAANAIREAKESKAKARIDNLEMMLKSSGLHLSQNKELIAA
jgi:hypothetical protein